MTADHVSALIRVTDLDDLLSRRPPVLLDVRWDVGAPPQFNAYIAGHIPGARFCDLDADLAGAPGAGGRHPLPDPKDLQDRFRAWGIAEDSCVVVYDGAASVAAARAWWILRWAGLTDVRVLDGGFAAWVDADLPVHTGAEPHPDSPSVQTGSVATVRPGRMPTIDSEAAASLARAGRLVDVRAPERFTGQREPIDPVAGRIPGAKNMPSTSNLTAAGTFKPPATLRAQWAAADLPTDGAALGVYCGSGVTAAQTLLAMHEAGVAAALYPGSWSEWITDPSRPVETG